MRLLVALLAVLASSLFFGFFKVLGLVLIALGFLILKDFPDPMQRERVTRAGLLIGALISLAGLIMVVL